MIPKPNRPLLGHLLQQALGVSLMNLTSIPVTGIAIDSREVEPGNIFVALSGLNRDGHCYIPAALQNGAGAVIGSQEVGELPVPFVRVDDTRQALADLAAAFYQHPAKKLTVIGVTGTDGKTTTANLIHHVLQTAGKAAGIISTVNAVIGDEVLDTGFHVTTPEAHHVQYYLWRMVEAGLTHVVIEATSHGLAQKRVANCEFDIGVVTNITHEHLDYHVSYEEYRNAKAELFRELSRTVGKPFAPPPLAILNQDDRSYTYLKEITRVRKVAYSLVPGADLWAEHLSSEPEGNQFTICTPKHCLPMTSTLVGDFNIANCLAAAGATWFGLGVDPQVIRRAFKDFSGIPGRMEWINMGQPFQAIVDFAHTPFALQCSLETARALTQGRVLAVFGSAGLRDRQKRRMMAAVSAKLADITILTAEDPRTESLTGILEEMKDEMNRHGGVEGKNFWRIGDRRDAIRFAIREAKPGDLVIACGKGHEQSMCFGEKEYLWDDRVAMRAALAEHFNIPGPEMPFLPSWDR